MNENTIRKLFGGANILYALGLVISVGLFYAFLPVTEIGTNYSLLVEVPAWIPVNVISLVSIILGIIGLAGMFKKMADSCGPFVFAGFLLVAAGFILKACATSWELVIWPLLMKNHPGSPLLTESLIYADSGILSFYGLFTLCYTLGYIFIGLGGIRKNNNLPKWALVLLMIGGPAYSILLSVPPFGIIGLLVYAGGIWGIGLSLVKDDRLARVAVEV